MQEKRIYTVNSTKLNNAYLEGFAINGDTLVTEGDQDRHVVIFNRFRSYEKETKWGRFYCGVDLSQAASFKILVLASDGDEDKAVKLNDSFHSKDVAWDEKRKYFENDGIIYEDKKDVLLYEVKGEYLWIALEVISDSGVVISGMKLDSQGDNFMQTFPEIYREEGNFFHRYMSIFSSIYQDMSDRLENMDIYLDIDKVPLSGLTQIAGWLGFETREDFLEEPMLRKFIKHVYSLNRIKGTKQVLEEIIDLVLGDEAVIMERSKMENHIPSVDSDIYKRLYGDTIYDATILVKHGEDEKLQAKIMVLLEEFKPIRSRLKLIFAEKCFNLDSYCYLDFNASLDKKTEAYIGGNNKMNGMVKLG
jgi:phage tail-like protein